MSDNDRSHQIRSAASFVAENFTELQPMIEGGSPISLGYGVCDGFTSHLGVVDESWFTSYGHRAFLGARVPTNFCFVGTQNRGSAEYLVAMWADQQRRFWFYDSYVCFVADSDKSVQRTRNTLQDALKRWQQGENDVLFSGPSGQWVSEADDIPYLE